MVEDEVAFDHVLHTAGAEDAVAHRQQCHVDGRGVGLVVRVDDVADDGGLALGVAQLVAAAVGHDAGAVVAERRVDDEQVAARVGARIAETVVLADDLVDHRVAREALADVHAGIGATGGVDVVELALHRIEGVHAVVAGAVGGEVRAAVALRPGPEEPVRGVVRGGHVLDRHTLRAQHADAVVEFEVAVEHHRVAVEAADGEVVGGDVDGLVVGAGGDEHEVAWLGCIDGALDGGHLARYFQHTVGAGFGQRGLGCRGGRCRCRGVGCCGGFRSGSGGGGVGCLVAAACGGEQRQRAEHGECLEFHGLPPVTGHGAVTVIVPTIPTASVPWMEQ